MNCGRLAANEMAGIARPLHQRPRCRWTGRLRARELANRHAEILLDEYHDRPTGFQSATTRVCSYFELLLDRPAQCLMKGEPDSMHDGADATVQTS